MSESIDAFVVGFTNTGKIQGVSMDVETRQLLLKMLDELSPTSQAKKRLFAQISVSLTRQEGTAGKLPYVAEVLKTLLRNPELPSKPLLVR